MKGKSKSDLAYLAAVVFHIFVSILIFTRGGWQMLGMGVLSLLFLLLPWVVRWLFRIRLNPSLSAAILFLCTLGYSLGTVLRAYDILPGYDKVLHFASGILFTLLGVCLYGLLAADQDRSHKVLLQVAFGFGFSMFIAVLWEIFEYVGFLLTGHDAQNVAATGVGDTMGDLIACFGGSLLVLLDGWLFYRKGRSPGMWVVREFDRENAQHPLLQKKRA